MRHWLLPALLLAVISPVFAQHGVNNRQQWQARAGKDGFDPDRRLEQPIKIEIVGHSAAVTMAKLSKLTGVSLGVAPEDVKTLGERKLAIFANNVPLRYVMIHAAGALQECHWDIVESGAKPTYLLHRHAGTEDTIAWLSQRELRRKETEGRSAREARVNAARAALAMSPEQLAELAKTDPFLVESIKDERNRPYLEMFFNLPQESMDQFLDSGQVKVDFGNFPEQIQQSILESLQRNHKGSIQGEKYTGQTEDLKELINNLRISTLEFKDGNELPSYSAHNPGIFYSVHVSKVNPSGTGLVSMSWGQGVLNPKYPVSVDYNALQETVFKAAGIADQETRRCLTVEFQQRKTAEEARWVESKHPQDWQEPTDPELLRTIKFSAKEPLELAEIQKMLAEKTGFAVISDYFASRALPLPQKAANEMPLWRFLNLLGEQRGYIWQKAGKCLIFHHAKWFDMINTDKQ